MKFTLNTDKLNLLIKILIYYKQTKYILVPRSSIIIDALSNEDIIELVGDYLFEFGIENGNINSIGLEIEDLIDILNRQIFIDSGGKGS